MKLTLLRQDKPVEVGAVLVPTSKPLRMTGRRPFLGVEWGERKEGEGVRILQVAPGSPAAVAGLKKGDFIQKIDGMNTPASESLAKLLSEKQAGDLLTLLVRRSGKEVELMVTLAAEGGHGLVGSSVWTREVFRLAVIGVEFPDVKHNPKIHLQEWEEMFFSRGRYVRTSATGQAVHGSLNDYFHEQSAGAFHIVGRVFPWIEVGQKRDAYGTGSSLLSRSSLFAEALTRLTARAGKDALKDFDGFLFLYAGEQVATNRGGLYYPHAGSVLFQEQRRPYVLGPEGGSRMVPIGTFVKELGLVLGLPDLAARPEDPGSEGLGVWCAMSNTLGGSRPQHLCAWCKEKLGWVKPVILDPTVKQKVILAPLADSSRECVKVLVRPDLSEYFLLENRRRKGFDADLPGEGLLIWRVVNQRPILEESHGVEGPSGPRVFPSAVPYPSAANNAFTPDTTPSSRSLLGGGLPVFLTEIRKLPDGRMTFHIGYEYR